MFTAEGETKIVIISIGYADGLSFASSRNSLGVIIKGIVCPIIGNICMDTTIDEWFRMQSGCTVPAAEIRGVRCSLTLAHMYKPYYKYINIF